MTTRSSQYPNGAPPEQDEVPNPPPGSIDPLPPSNLDENRASQYPDGLPPEQASPPLGGGGGVSDHGDLLGLGDNDHPQYPLKNGNETIGGLWNFGVVPTVLGQPVFYPGNLDPSLFALKATTLTSADPQTLNISGGNLGANSVFTPITNVGDGLVKLNALGKIPLSLSPLTLLNFLGVYNNSGANSGKNPSEAFPLVDFNSGDVYIVGEDDGTTITLKDADTGLDYEQAVNPGDDLLYVDTADVPQAPATGWYYLARNAVTSAASVFYSQSTTVLTTGANLQAALEELSVRVAFKDRPLTVSGLWNFTTAPTIGGETVWHSGNHNEVADPHSQYPLIAGAENISGGWTVSGAWTVSGLWNFTTAPTIGGSVILTAANHAGSGDPHTQYALKTTPVTTGDAETLTVGSATIGGGVQFTARTNVGNGLAKLNPQGKIPLSLSVLSLLNILGVYNNSGANSGLNPSEAFPGNTYNTGDVYIIGDDDGTTITLKDVDTGADYEQPVNPGDDLIYINTGDTPQAPATGWYYIERGTATSASNILYSPTGTSFVSVNVQDALDEVNDYWTRKDRIETIGAAWNFTAQNTFLANQVLKDPAGSATVMNRYLSFRSADDGERGWVGFGGVNADEFDVANNIGAVGLRAATNLLFVTGGNLWGSVNASGGWSFYGGPFAFNGTDLSLGGNSAAYASLNLNAQPGTERQLTFASSGLNRWVIRGASSEGESGGDAGSNFQLLRYNDAGAFLATTLQIQRASGAMSHYGSAVYFNDPDVYVSSSTYAQLHLLGGAGNGKVILFRDQPSGNNRWQIGVDSGAESGSNAGSDFDLRRFNDSGVFLGQSMWIRRSDGYTEFAAPSWNFNGNIIRLGGPTAGGATFVLNAASAVNRLWQIETASVARWNFGTDGVPESGANAGCEFIINRYADDGSYLGRALTIFRNTGEVVINGSGAYTSSIGLTVIGTLYSQGDRSHIGTQVNYYPGAGVNYEFVNRNGGGFDFYVNSAGLIAAKIFPNGEFVINSGVAQSGQAGLSVVGLYTQVGNTMNFYPGTGVDTVLQNVNGGGWRFTINNASAVGFSCTPAGEFVVNGTAGVHGIPGLVVNGLISAVGGAMYAFPGDNTAFQFIGANGGWFSWVIDNSTAVTLTDSAFSIFNRPLISNSSGTFQSNIYLDGADKYFRFGSNAGQRWIIGSETPDSGGPGGAGGQNLVVYAYDNDGNLRSTPLTINRATGVVNFQQTPTVAGVPLGGFIGKAGIDVPSSGTSVVPGITITVPAAGIYHLRARLVMTQVTGANGHQYMMSADNVISLRGAWVLWNKDDDTQDASKQTGINGNSIPASGATCPGASKPFVTEFSGVLNVSAAGAVTVQFANNSGSGPLTMLAGSVLEAF